MAKKSDKKIVRVRLTGEFPLDMLRYDRCCPYSETDSRVMREDSDKPREVELLCFSEGGPTIGRWQSFGCDIVGVRSF